MIESVSTPGSPMEGPPAAKGKWRRKRRGLIAAALVLLLAAIFLPPFININRFRRTIVRSISSGLGRPVEASSVELQLFPRPGFVLHDLTVGENPEFGAEPVMMAQTVTAGLRASTLWHRRVEIASLSFDAPSVNLVRDAQGHWNFESLLHNSPALHSRKGHTSASPPPFPYVEAADARINFKQGPEKLPFSLEDANLALWKESSDEWRLRIKARPVRTDLAAEDAGQIRGRATLRTGAALMDARIQASLEWRRVQLGEIGRLFHGEDNGWRGTVDWTASANGTLGNASLTSDIAVEGFRRAEFIPAAEMDLSAHCKARYALDNPLLDALQCDAPMGNGRLVFRGMAHRPGSTGAKTVQRPNNASMHRNSGAPAFSFPLKSPAALEIAVHDVSAGFVLNLLGHIHPGIVSDATASGQVNGTANCDWRSFDALSGCTGKIQTGELHLRFANLDRPLVLSPATLVSTHGSAATAWRLQPVRVSMGATAPATITGTIGFTGAALRMNGPASLSELDRVAQALRIPALSGEVQSIRGDAQLALSLESTWLPRSQMDAADEDDHAGRSVQPIQTGEFVHSRWTGHVKVSNATLKIASLPQRLRLASAQVNLTANGVEWDGLEGIFADTPFDGSIQWQTPCLSSRSACRRTFVLHTADLDVDRIQAVLRTDDGALSLLNRMNPWAPNSLRMPEIAGTLNADTLSVGQVSVKNAVLKLHMQGRKAELTEVSGNLLGGTLSGQDEDTLESGSIRPLPDKVSSGNAGSMDWSGRVPEYTLRIKMEHMQPNKVAAIWDEQWGNGSANVKIDLRTRGWSAADLARNASGDFTISWLNGALQPFTQASSTNAPSIEKFRRWTASGKIRNRTLVLRESQLVPLHGGWQQRKEASAAQTVTGTVTFDRRVNLKFQPSGISVTGLLDSPVETAAEKPLVPKGKQ